MTILKQLYDEWVRHTQNPDSPPDQVKAVRQAFYSGAIGFREIMTSLGHPSLTDNVIHQSLESIHDEITEFVAELALDFAIGRTEGEMP